MSCDADGHCVTFSDEGVPMRVVATNAEGLAVCAGGVEVMTDLVEDGAHGRGPQRCPPCGRCSVGVEVGRDPAKALAGGIQEAKDRSVALR